MRKKGQITLGKDVRLPSLSKDRKLSPDYWTELIHSTTSTLLSSPSSSSPSSSPPLSKDAVILVACLKHFIALIHCWLSSLECRLDVRRSVPHHDCFLPSFSPSTLIDLIAVDPIRFRFIPSSAAFVIKIEYSFDFFGSKLVCSNKSLYPLLITHSRGSTRSHGKLVLLFMLLSFSPFFWYHHHHHHTHTHTHTQMHTPTKTHTHALWWMIRSGKKQEQTMPQVSFFPRRSTCTQFPPFRHHPPS